MRTGNRIVVAALILAFAGTECARANPSDPSSPTKQPLAALSQQPGAQISAAPAAGPKWTVPQPDNGTLVHLASHSAAVVPFRLGTPPSARDGGLMAMVPRLGHFDLTFYSDVPASGLDGMVNADVVVSLTRHF